MLFRWCATAEAWKFVDSSVESEASRELGPNTTRELRTANRELAYTLITIRHHFILNGDWRTFANDEIHSQIIKWIRQYREDDGLHYSHGSAVILVQNI